MPPNTIAVRSGVLVAYWRTLSPTWSANSRVGTRISARTGWRAGDMLALARGSRRCRIGSANPAVLPVPVWAAPITSPPLITIGIALDWIGVGRS